ncbi:MAG: T9SS type A sorting domain-containing protein [Flavobacterium sp.]|uniref:T9SS type A sorting domain-containing protein n=1 Tax=Flavobacterium sp. TaxID=239 RepID=UPI0032652CA6
MKKIYLLGALIATTLSFGQNILNEDFNYTVPGFVGGNLTTANDGVGSNNWLTHSNTAGNAGTIDVLSGNLSYTGLLSSTGNRILLPGNNTAVPRDINRAITTSATTVYYSLLINVIDNTQLSTTTPNYFTGIGATAGTGVTTLGARLGAYSTNAGANYRLSIQNTSGGTPTFTDFATDLTFGTTYLVVIKYDRAASPTAVSLWVNPSSVSFGSTEPAGSVSNNSGTGAITAFASVFLRNTATTPKVEMDEIRIGQTWADVTPVALSTKDFGNISGLKIYPNPAKNNLNISSDSFEVKNVEIYNVLGAQVLSANVTNSPINIAGLTTGVYVVKVTEEGKTATRKLVIE